MFKGFTVPLCNSYTFYVHGFSLSVQILTPAWLPKASSSDLYTRLLVVRFQHVQPPGVPTQVKKIALCELDMSYTDYHHHQL